VFPFDTTTLISLSFNKTVAHLSQIQHQLQTDPQNPSLNKTTYPQNMSVQQQLQSLSQMVYLIVL
jgi:hypothetical protein